MIEKVNCPIFPKYTSKGEKKIKVRIVKELIKVLTMTFVFSWILGFITIPPLQVDYNPKQIKQSLSTLLTRFIDKLKKMCYIMGVKEGRGPPP